MKTSSQRGSVLIVTLTFLMIMIVGVGSVLELSMSAYKLSQRNDFRARARAVAESELENLYSAYSAVIVRGGSPRNVPVELAGMADAGPANPTTPYSPFTAVHQAEPGGWIIHRSIETNVDSVSGQLPGSGKWGKFSYYTAKIEVLPGANSPYKNTTIAVRIGRHFNNSTSSIFQYSIFFQGDLELAPGVNTMINGDIAANGSIFMGSSGAAVLQFSDSASKINYMANQNFNQTVVSTTDTNGVVTSSTYTTYRKPGTYNTSTGSDVPETGATDLHPPKDADGITDIAPGNAKLNQMQEEENLLGGLDAPTIARDRSDLFGPTDTTANTAIAENNVYHSQIVPPPNKASAADYPPSTDLTQADDPRIAAIRAYNRAALILTVEADGTVSYTQVTGAGTPSRVETTSSTITANFAGVATNTTMYDDREGKAVNVTEVDVGALKTALAAHFPPGLTGTDFNGLLYVNLKNATVTSGAITTPTAVRLVNAADTPAMPNPDPAHPGTSLNTGFSVATNGGMYIKGDFNTTDHYDSDGNVTQNPAMVMADAVTVLSTSWVDSPTHTDINASRTVPVGTAVTINAGILTGNVAATATDGSGGAQNLVRYLEQWGGRGAVTFNGSLGRLFNSNQFTSPFKTGAAAVQIYTPPSRSYSYNTALQKSTPPGSPDITKFSRGSFFNW